MVKQKEWSEESPGTAPGLEHWVERLGLRRVLEGLAAVMSEAVVFAVDAERRVILWSRGATEILGFAAREVLGEHCLKSNRCQNCMQRCGIEQLGEVRDVPLTLVRADGTTVRLRKTARAFFDADGAFAGGVEVLVPDARPEPVVLEPAPDMEEFHGLRTRDPAMKAAIQVVRNVAPTDTPVLVRGESGTGKELIARALHQESRRAGRPFLAVNCAALTPTLLESELFGHRKGAFTGADRDRPGLFAQADGGTLFLDEVAELPVELQPKLLRVLQEQSFVPVGGVRARKVDVRILSATHKSLRAEVAAGRFREDLMYRLRVVPIFLPPLRERPRDIELLLRELVAARNGRGGRQVQHFSPRAMRALLDHAWPGNVREMQNVVEYAFAVGRGPEVQLEELPPEFREDERAPPVPARAATRRDAERQKIEEALRRAGGDLQAAAELLGMSRTTFWRKRKRLGLVEPRD